MLKSWRPRWNRLTRSPNASRPFRKSRGRSLWTVLSRATRIKKISALRDASKALGPVLNPPQLKPAPSDQDNVAAIRGTADALSQAAAGAKGDAADAARKLF